MLVTTVHADLGRGLQFNSLEEFEQATRKAGRRIPEDGLQEGRDYYILSEKQIARQKHFETTDGVREILAAYHNMRQAEYEWRRYQEEYAFLGGNSDVLNIMTALDEKFHGPRVEKYPRCGEYLTWYGTIPLTTHDVETLLENPIVQSHLEMIGYNGENLEIDERGMNGEDLVWFTVNTGERNEVSMMIERGNVKFQVDPEMLLS